MCDGALRPLVAEQYLNSGNPAMLDHPRGGLGVHWRTPRGRCRFLRMGAGMGTAGVAGSTTIRRETDLAGGGYPIRAANSGEEVLDDFFGSFTANEWALRRVVPYTFNDL